MKNLYIISCYANTEQKKSVLINYINQVKKLINFDILLVSHIPVSEDILNLTDYFIYDSDNFLFPIDRSPSTFFILGNIKINILSCRHGYAFMKNVHNALRFAKSMSYDSFIFSDYDCILGNEDLIKLEQIPFILKENEKKVFMFKHYNKVSSLGYYYESKFFAGDVNYFIDNISLPNSYDYWNNIEPYKSSGNVVEDILVSLLNKFEDKLYLIEDDISKYFLSSSFDIFHHYDYKYSPIYNLDDKYKPIFFCISPEEGTFELCMNDNTLFNINCKKGQWLLYVLNVDCEDFTLQFLRNGKVLINKAINIDSLEDTKDVAFAHYV